MKNVFFAAFFGAACCLSGCRQEAATPATGEHYAFAEEMFRKVWDMYRVPEYGLFSEYYPNSYRPDVNYFDDGAKSTQEVSFLWPMDGVFTSAVALAEVDPVKYGCYVDSMVMAVEQYYDDGRMPAGYQAYPVRMGKVDRYYDDNGLVGLAYVAAYGVTRNPAHLEKAKQVMTFILSGWRPDHDGAVSWLEGVENQKPGCANGKAMLLALNLYGATGDPYYLTAGRRFYDWMDAYLHDPELDIPSQQGVGRRAAPHLHMGAFPGQADQAPVLVLQPAYGSRRCPGARGERQTGRREDPRNVRPQGVRDPHGRFQRRPEQPHLYDLHRLGGIGRFV